MCWILTVPVLVALRLCAEAALPVLKCSLALCALTSQLQVFRHEPYNEKCDVYSFAMICSHLGFTQFPRCLLFSGQPHALLVRVAGLGRTLLLPNRHREPACGLRGAPS